MQKGETDNTDFSHFGYGGMIQHLAEIWIWSSKDGLGYLIQISEIINILTVHYN